MSFGGQEVSRHRTTDKGSYAEANSGLAKGVSERRQVEDALRHVVEGISVVVGKAFYTALVRNLALALKVRFAFVSRLHKSTEGQVQLLALWEGDDFGEPLTRQLI